jgi:hypothetical protein
MKTDQELRAYAAAHLGLSFSTMADNLRKSGVTAGDFHRAVGMKPAAPATVSAPQTAKAAPVRVKPKTLDDFRKAFDNPQKIRNGLATLADGGWLNEEEFRRFCDIPVQLWRRNADLPEFADHKLKHAGITHWAGKATIQEMKTIIGAA